jgi:eukaryotic-like serine/threonine-protein kinase
MDETRSANWEKVKALFEEVLAHPFAERDDFLARAAAGDDWLRHEVESLIKSYEAAESFMEQPAAHAAAESLLEHQKKVSIGERISHYEILGTVGEGGMGEVYLARDTTLGRRVALKLLPDYFTSNEHRLRRFKQEARAASILSHPNVCVIHEVGETEDGRPFITMEYVEGSTLRQRMSARNLGLRGAVDIAIQIADALAAAHDAGIVHRDIKPENIILRPDGYVKVLDFGLAKLSDHPEGFDSQTATTLMKTSTPGLVMGTVAYMSPEQARGVTVDHRTDIWSLGVVLYEMISGRVPFEGETPTDIVVGIIQKEQPLLAEVVEGLPHELDRIVRKTLRKDCNERYQLAKELAIDLRTLRRELEVDGEINRAVAQTRSSPAHRTTAEVEETRRTTTLPLSLSSRRLQSPAVLILATLLIGAIAFVVYRLVRRTPAAASRFQRINVTKMTTNGNAAFAAISRDGKYVAYVKAEGGRQSLWLRQVAVESNVRLLPAKDGNYLGIAFSPDGNYIYYGYVEGNSQRPELFKVPALGGAAPTRADLYNGPDSLSHDGKRIAFFRYDEQQRQDFLIIANPDGANEQVLASRKWPERFGWNWDARPAWSADDQTLSCALVSPDNPPIYIRIYELNLSNRSENIITLTGQKFELLDGVSLLDDASGVMTTAKAQGASFFQVWQLFRDGTARQVTRDLSDYLGMSLPADSKSIVTVQRQVLSNIWVAPKSDPLHPTAITSGAGRYFDITWAPDGRILYASDASGSANIYEMDLESTTSRALTDVGRNYAPAVSPDNRFIVFHSNRSGMFQIWRAERDGSNPIQLTKAAESNWPQFSADGKWVIYQTSENGAAASIWKIPVDGGTPVSIVNQTAIRPVLSPDGNWIACWTRQPDQTMHLGVFPLSGERQTKLFDVAPTVQVTWDVLIRWSADSKSTTYVDHRGGVDNLWSQPLDGSAAKQITDFKEGRIFSFDWSRDSRLSASRGVQTNDVVLISEVK